MENYTKYHSILFSWVDMRMEESLYCSRRLEAFEAKRILKLHDRLDYTWSIIIDED